ncbi:hypothetical protein BJY00DRAFT_310357 [Aspergillus carlsbadensis]|nr:hypothetical protein BJY00DRAFT_310357 [Aspergillus carlsbadensis]
MVSLALTTPVLSQDTLPAGDGTINVYYAEARWDDRPPCADLNDIGCLDSHGRLNTDPSCATFSSNGNGDISVAGMDSLLHLVRNGGGDAIPVLETGTLESGSQVWTTAGDEAEGVCLLDFNSSDLDLRRASSGTRGPLL